MCKAEQAGFFSSEIGASIAACLTTDIYRGSITVFDCEGIGSMVVELQKGDDESSKFGDWESIRLGIGGPSGLGLRRS